VSTYAIGDVQGCYRELLALLDLINFDQNNDQLWFTGDLVNRGPGSLETLRFVKQLGTTAITVLGNHDLHLLAIANGQSQYLHKSDTLNTILKASDKYELLTWLRMQPLIHQDLGFTLVHSGIPPQWDSDMAQVMAVEVEATLRDGNYIEFFAHMYGNQPKQWSDTLSGWDRLRFITNCFTRMRYCDQNGKLEFKEKGLPGTQNPKYQPWFEINSRKSRSQNIIFGHWAALRDYKQDYDKLNVYPVDMGCAWGDELAAMRLEDKKYFKVPSQGII